MRVLSWQEFDQAVDQAVERFSDRCRQRRFSGVHGLPRGGLVLAVSLSHRLELPLLPAPQPGCLLVDDIYETGRTLAPHRHLQGALPLVWISKVEPTWWQALEINPDPDWIVFPWEDRRRALEDERRYRASRR